MLRVTSEENEGSGFSRVLTAGACGHGVESSCFINRSRATAGFSRRTWLFEISYLRFRTEVVREIFHEVFVLLSFPAYSGNCDERAKI